MDQAARPIDDIEPLFEGSTEEKEKMTLSQRYLSLLLRIRNRPLRVRLPYGSKVDGKPITEIPRISSLTVEEVEMSAIEENYSYSRISYDSVSAEYLYEVIEPKLTEDEMNLLDVLKKALIVSLNLSSDPSVEHRNEVLNKAADMLMLKLGLSLQPISRERILYYLRRDFVGYGAINVMMIDPNIEDCSCDGVGIPLYIYHRKYGSIQTNIVFEDERELDEYVVWLAQKCGKHISVANPLLDATIPDGSRLNATLGKHVTKRGSSFTIRRFKDNPFTPVDLIKFRTMNVEMMAFLWISVEFGSSMMVCGGTASGKTTTLNAILLFIPPQMKIVSIEDTRELNLPHENWIPGLTREGFAGRGNNSGNINMFDLLTAALRQRPQYLMVGEVRGKEAYVVFQAMATGHISYSTFHAEDVQSMVHRLENDPINLPRALLSSLDLVLLQGQVKVGTKMTRRAKALTELVGMDPETGELITNSVFYWNPADDSFTYSGHSYIYEKVRAVRNWSPREMEREVKRRMDILEYMMKIGVNNYRQVAKIVSAYYKDPEKVMREVRGKTAE
jgi:flagellar protein FlaI